MRICQGYNFIPQEIATRAAACIICLLLLADTSAYAAGFRPVARDDEISVPRGGSADRLVSGAISVLDNDFDFERDPLTVRLQSDVRHGTLTLNPDGTFLYVHDGGDDDDDRFRYVAFDGTRTSRRADVDIEITTPTEPPPRENNPPFVVAPVADQAATEGEPFSLDLAAHFGDVDEGDTLTFASAGLPPSGTISLDSASGAMTGTPQLTDALDLPYQIVVTAEDDQGATAVLAFRLSIAVRDRPDLAVTVKVEPNLVTFRDSPQWEIQVENLGPGPLSEAFLEAEWFSSEAPVTLSLAENCDIFANNTTEPTVQCVLTDLPAEAMTTVTVQSTHVAPGDSNIRAVISSDDPRPENNSAVLSLNLAANFSEGPTQFLPASGTDIASGDLNLDGHLDLVVVADEALIFLNDGQRRLTTPGQSLGPLSSGVSIALLDWNLDGAPDIAIASGGEEAGQLFLNDGLGGFPTQIDLPTSQTSVMVATDLDGDGLAELIVSGAQGTFLVRNDGQGAPETTLLHSAVARHLAGGDLSGDGLPDLVVTDAQTRAVYLLTNDGSGVTFTEEVLDYGSVAGVTLYDVDGDGALDLLIAIDSADLNVPQNRILRNLQTGEFSDWAFVGAAPTAEFIAGDVNGDDLSDLIAVNETGVHQIFIGDGAGSFLLADEHILSLGIFRATLVDINGDDSLDLILAGENSNRVDVHANDGLGKFGPGDTTPPTLNLVGGPTMTLDAGDLFQDPGATAVDDIDGDITAAIETLGMVTTEVVGDYTITYSVSDRSGNLIEITRIVSVEAQTSGGGGGGAIGSLFVLSLTGFAIARRRYRLPPGRVVTRI